MLLAPLSANTLARASLGLCPNLLTSVIRAWHYDLDESLGLTRKERIEAENKEKEKNPNLAKHKAFTENRTAAARDIRPFVAAPSMNTYMLAQRVTEMHVQVRHPED